MRVVLDTNTVLSAILFPKGRLTWIRDLWVAKEIVPLVSRQTSEELIRTLAYPKFGLEKDDIEVLLGTYLPYVEAINVGVESLEDLPSCRDPEDQKFLLLAAKGEAEVLVTGDRTLVELSGQTTFGIETPAQFKKRFF